MKRSAFVLSAAALPLLPLRARAGAASVPIPFELLANGIYIPVRVDGQGPFSFAIDTGSYSSIVAAEFLTQLGITATGLRRASGEGSDSSALATIGRVAFELPQQTTVVSEDAASVGLSALWPLIGRPFYGNLGYDVLKQFVVEIDYANRILSLHDPQRYRPSGNGTTYPATFWNSYGPQIDGTLAVAGRPAIPVKCTLDTGGGGTIVASPLVDDARLLESVGKTVALPNHGVGNGTSRPLTARLTGLTIGSYALEAPLVALSQDRVGSFASRSLSIDAGGDVLRRFSVTIDYANDRVTLEPNRYFGMPFEADASGLVIAAEGNDYRTFVVSEVVPDSAGARAGIAPGDAIVTIDSVAAAQFALWEIEDRLKRSGTIVVLGIRRGTAVLTRQVGLQALI
ncbi:MAG: aspartyl protease family protein [Candidatus Eremiobacteraeota bacterium]|nr:aspartyl protease family protein [Candidatus Eremiobacteraeota bacterium]